jgi:hypothetical protein
MRTAIMADRNQTIDVDVLDAGSRQSFKGIYA